MAKEKNPGATDKELKIAADKLRDSAEGMARANLSNRFAFSGSKFKSKFLEKRKELKKIVMNKKELVKIINEIVKKQVQKEINKILISNL